MKRRQKGRKTKTGRKKSKQQNNNAIGRCTESHKQPQDEQVK